MSDPRGDDERNEPELESAEEPREAAAPAADAPASPGRSLGIVLGLFALLVAFAAIGGIVFTWWQVYEERVAASDRLADIVELVATTERQLAAQEERISAFDRLAEERRRTLEALDAQVRLARERLEDLAREEAGPERAPSLAEIEFLLLLANRELVLADNARVALAALREADQRLARLDEPGLDAVRAAIHDEIAAVEAVADIDRDGIALRLGSLARRVNGLPLRGSLAPDPGTGPDAGVETSGWERLAARVRAAAAALFRVRRTDVPATPLLSPEETFFLYRNVELDLKSARLAALARDQDNYAAALESARLALEEYFDTGDEAVRSLVAAIEALEQRTVAPEWPEISRSLALLRAAGARG